LNIFERCKKPLLEQNFSLIKVNFEQIFMAKILPKSLPIFSRKNFAIKNCPNGKILPNLVTLMAVANTLAD
jgi:hypothetical protein